MRMAALQAVAQESAVGLDGLWWWSRSRLQGALGWSDSVMATVERYRASQGESPDLEVPGEVVLPMDGDWPICLNRLERLPLALHRGGRSDSGSAACRCCGGDPIGIEPRFADGRTARSSFG